MSEQFDNYGKIKNNRLILAPTIIARDGKVLVQDVSLYKSLGYKKIKYNAPLANKPGYDLIYAWEEQDDTIQQVWNYRRIEEDYSSELLCSIRNFNYAIDCILDTISDAQSKNDVFIKEYLDNNPIINIIWKCRPGEQDDSYLLDLFYECELNIQDFFDKLKIKEQIKNLGYKIYNQYIVSSNPRNGEEETFLFTYIKSSLYNLYSHNTFSDLRSETVYDMSYIYAFTLFDELLLKFARYMCSFERNWLSGQETISAKDLVGCVTIEDVHRLMIEEKISKLAWGGYTDKLDFFRGHGIKIEDQDSSLFCDDVLYISEKRNIIVHNSGIWNIEACKKLKNTSYAAKVNPGDSVKRTAENIKSECEQLRRAANKIYDILCSKFDLINRYKVEQLEAEE